MQIYTKKGQNNVGEFHNGTLHCNTWRIKMSVADSGGMPLDCIFVTFRPNCCISIFGHQLIPCLAAWEQKQNTEHALMTAADTDRSLQLVLQQGHGTPIWTAAGRVGSDDSYNTSSTSSLWLDHTSLISCAKFVLFLSCWICLLYTSDAADE